MWSATCWPAGYWSSSYWARPTDSSEIAVHERCVLALKPIIQALTLDGIPSDHVYDLIFQDDNVTLNAVVLTTDGLNETQPGTLTGLDDIGYPVRISVLMSIDGNIPAVRARVKLNRQRIFRAIRNQRLGMSVPEVFTVRVEPGPIVQAKRVMLGTLTAWCLSREVRGR